MNRIKVENFGPIRDSGWVEVKKVTVFLGNQGSGKSTIAKLISTFSWMEKALFRGDVSAKWLQRKGRFRSSLLSYHRLENYFAKGGKAACLMAYEGEHCDICFDGQDLKVEENKRPGYVLPQITYIPAERNFISYVRTAKDLKQTSESFKTFAAEFDNAKRSIKENVRLPLSATLEYDRLNDVLHLKGSNYKIKLSEAASGFQSFAPLYMVMHHLSTTVSQTGRAEPDMTADERQRFHKNVAEIYANPDLTDEQRRIALSALSQQFKKEALISIIEEPEQNLFPSSQNKMLFSLLDFNNQRPANRLIVTTHSPYLVNSLTLAVQGAELKRKIIEQNRNDLLDRLDAIVPVNAVTPTSDVAVYQFDESEGTVTTLPMPNGIPSDANYLNASLGASNDAFDRLLDIEEELE